MRPATRLALLLIACTACVGGPDDDRAAAARDSSARAVTPPTSVSTTAPDAEARAVCAATAAAWRSVSRVAVRELDTLLTTSDVIEDPADSVAPPGAVGGRWPACAVEGYAAAGLDSAAQRASYWPAAGWVVFPRLNADGPGGQVQVYQRGWVRCQVAGEWDPGDDGDSAYVPTPFFRERTLCWRHGRLVVPRDTISLGG